MPNPGLFLQVDHALESNDLKRQKLVALLNNDQDEILVDREFLSSLYARLGNDSLVLQKLVQEIRALSASSES